MAQISVHESSAISSWTSYRYTPLPTPSHTRLLQLLPGAWDAPIKCTIEIVDLEDKPAYNALSYTWGNPNPKARISIGESFLEVTQNLHAALQRLRHRRGYLQKFWIDAVCINQSDSSERTQQVTKMRNIYQLAQQVVVWLGLDPWERGSNTWSSWSGLRLLLARFLHRRPTDKEWVNDFDSEGNLTSTYRSQLVEELRAALWMLFPKLKAPPQFAFHRLLQQSWFNRAWILQEIVAASAVVVLYGSQEYSWGALINASSRMDLATIDLPNRKTYQAARLTMKMTEWWNRVRSEQYPSVPLLELLDTAASLNATEPRDKIFALLGIADDTSRLGLEPSYALPAADVFSHCTKQLISTYQNLDGLAYCYLRAQDPNQPSWVPDWGNTEADYLILRPQGRFQNNAQDEAALGPIAECSPDGRRLKAKGMICSKIKIISDPWVDETIKDTLAFNFTASHYTALWQMLRQWYTLANESSIYGTDHSAKAEAFTATLYALPWASSTFDRAPGLRVWFDELDGRLDTRFAPRKTRSPGFLNRLEQEYSDGVLAGKIEAVAEINISQQNDNQLHGLDYSKHNWFGALAQGRKFGITSKESMALLPPQAQKDDWICALRGVRLAFVLRKVEDGRHKLIGPCYVHGEIDWTFVERDSDLGLENIVIE